MNYILSIDEGTTGVTASLVDTQSQVVARAEQDFQQIYPQPGWVEHDAEVIWWTTENVLKKLLSDAKINSHQIKAIGITNQRETTVLWNKKTGVPIYNAIVWQDRRTAPLCEALKKKKLEKLFKQKTGLVLDAYFSGTKINWLLQNVEGARKLAQSGDLAFGTIDSFLLWKLTGATEQGGAVHATDVSNASRTLLMDIKSLKWDKKLCEILKVPQNILPEIKPSVGEFGRTKNLSYLPDGIPVTGIAGDQQAALFGQACFQAGEAKCTFGTGSFILMNTGKKMVASKAGCLTTVAWKIGKETTYALEGSTFICGAAVQWLRDGLGLFSHSADIEDLARSVDTTDGVEFVPALTGLGAPYWNPHARGVISGITRGTTKAHLARATLEGMALQNAEVLLAMVKDSGKKLTSLKVDGGASQNNLLMQTQADYLGCKIVRPQNVETTSMGAAFLAGLGVGIWKNISEIKSVWREDKVFSSEMKSRERSERLAAWRVAIEKA